MKSVRVMIADPLEEVVDALETLLAEDKRIELVARATSAQEALRKATVCRPNVIIMDVKFEDMGGGRVIRELSRRDLAVAVLILSPQAIKGNPLLQACLRAGAFDFIHRSNDHSELETITRQITTNVFVASFSKTKQIPTGSGEAEESAGSASIADLETIIIDCPGERARDILRLITSIEAGLRPAIICLIRRPPPFAEKLVEKLEGKTKVQIYNYRDGDYIVPGRLFIINSLEHDLILERNISGEWVQFVKSTTQRDRSIPLPGIDRLIDSLGRSYNNKSGAILLGGDARSSIEAFRSLKSRGGLTIIEEDAKELLGAIQNEFKDGQVPDDILSVDQLINMINSVGHG